MFVTIEAPCSKLQGIFDPQGRIFILIARSWIHLYLTTKKPDMPNAIPSAARLSFSRPVAFRTLSVVSRVGFIGNGVIHLLVVLITPANHDVKLLL
jgi:hypothetical protein